MTEYKPGDYIVGRYSENGSIIKPGKLVGDSEEIESLQKTIIEHSGRSGGRLLGTPDKPKKAKLPKSKLVKTSKPIAKEDIAEESLFPMSFKEEPKQESPPKRIYLQNQMGRIKLVVEDILENDMAFCLVFKNDDDIVLVPKAGETLIMVDPEGEEHLVYFADALFTWTDRVKKLMILFKTTEE